MALAENTNQWRQTVAMHDAYAFGLRIRCISMELYWALLYFLVVRIRSVNYEICLVFMNKGLNSLNSSLLLWAYK